VPAAFVLVETPVVETSLDSELPDAHVVWAEMIAGARRSIDLAHFYASNEPNSRLEPIIAALIAAQARGVRVRFLTEQSFVKTYPDTLDRFVKAGIQVRHYHRPPGILHAKLMIVDARDAFVGSQNFDWRALEHNLELGLRIRDAASVAALDAIFARDWARTGGEPIPTTRVAPSRVVASPRDDLPDGIGWDLPALVSLIDGARATIRIQLLTYLAGEWSELEAPLVRAAQRGVHVELFVADWTKRKHTLPGLQQLARTPNIRISFVTLPAWSGGFIPYARVAHAKLLVVDKARAWLGTSNWEHEYFYESRNLGVLVDSAALAARLDSFISATARYASNVDPDASYEPPRIDE
jgi:phosphatidylserine/phosphatidylglycerophosphate/cardiolipin synthase-like enzyme